MTPSIWLILPCDASYVNEFTGGYLLCKTSLVKGHATVTRRLGAVMLLLARFWFALSRAPNLWRTADKGHLPPRPPVPALLALG